MQADLKDSPALKKYCRSDDENITGDSNSSLGQVLRMTSLADLVQVSRRVGDSSSRRAKISAIAHLVRALEPDEIAIGVAYLSGETRQGRKGIGYALIREARTASVTEAPQLTLNDVDRALDQIMQTSGRGSLCLLYTSPSPRDRTRSRMPSSA